MPQIQTTPDWITVNSCFSYYYLYNPTNPGGDILFAVWGF